MTEKHMTYIEALGKTLNDTFHEEVNDAAMTVQEGGTLPDRFDFTQHGFDRAAAVLVDAILTDILTTTLDPKDHTRLCSCMACQYVRSRIRSFARKNGIELGEAG